MPAIAALTINDGATTPVAHTFSPVSTTGSKAIWADRSPSIPSGYRTISQEVLDPAGARTVYRVTWGFKNPTVASVSGSDTVVRFASAKLELNFHAESTLQERKDTLAYISNTLSNATMKTSVENLEPFY